MQSKLTQKVYTYIWPKGSMRWAEILFGVENDKIVFLKCNFYGASHIYTWDDWEFLRDLADEILMLEKEG